MLWEGRQWRPGQARFAEDTGQPPGWRQPPGRAQDIRGRKPVGKWGLTTVGCPAGCSVALYSFKRHALVAHLLCASIAIGPGYVAVTETDKRPRLPRSLLLTGRRLGERRGGGGTSLHREAGRDLAEVATLEQRLEEVQREPCAPPGSRVPPQRLGGGIGQRRGQGGAAWRRESGKSVGGGCELRRN